jgi:hypothetical protein
VINKLLERARGGVSNQPASLLLRLVKHKIEITNAQPRTSKIITNKSDGVPKCRFFSRVRRAIYTRNYPGGMRRIKKTPSCNVIFV